jgi:hypothetical protein
MPSWSDPFTSGLNSLTTYTGAFSATGGQVTSTSAGTFSISGYLAAGANLGPDHLAQIRVTTLDALASRQIGVATRVNSDGNNYQVSLDASSGGSLVVEKFVNFSKILIDQQSITISLPMVIRLESIGTTQRVLVDGVLRGTYTDSDVPLTNPFTGLYAWDGNNTVRADDFYAETIYVPPRVVGGYRATV